MFTVRPRLLERNALQAHAALDRRTNLQHAAIITGRRRSFGQEYSSIICFVCCLCSRPRALPLLARRQQIRLGRFSKKRLATGVEISARKLLTPSDCCRRTRKRKKFWKRAF